jgi:hypothetical protein
MSFRANRTAPRLFLLTGGALLVAFIASSCGLQETVVDGEQRAFEVEGPELVIDSGNSALTLIADEELSGEVLVTRWFKASSMSGENSISWEMDGDTLKLSTTCKGPLSNCSARHEIQIPADLAVRVTGRNGEVQAAGFRGGLTVHNHNGAIKIGEVDGPLSLESHNGSITATGVTAERVLASSHNGSIELGLSNAPAEIEADSHNGKIVISVPDSADYQVDAHAKNGQVEVLVDEGDEGHSVTARSNNGGITVRAG